MGKLQELWVMRNWFMRLWRLKFLPSASWRPRTANGVIQYESKYLKIRRAKHKPQSKGRRWDKMSEFMQRGPKRGSFLLPLSFILFGPSMDWTMPIHSGEGSLLCRVLQLKCWSHWEPPSQTHPEIMFNLGHTAAPPSSHGKIKPLSNWHPHASL